MVFPVLPVKLTVEPTQYFVVPEIVGAPLCDNTVTVPDPIVYSPQEECTAFTVYVPAPNPDHVIADPVPVFVFCSVAPLYNL